MLFIGFLAIHSLQTPNIIYFNAEKWMNLVEKRDPESVWIVYFQVNSHIGSKALWPVFVNASRIADGLFNFGTVIDSPEFPVSFKYPVKTVPTILFIHKTGYKEYKGKKNENDILRAAAKFLKDHTIQASKEWINEPHDTAILFTDKQSIPSLWVGISSEFRNKMRIGVTNSTEMMQAYGITKLPSIVMMNSSYRTIYKGKISFRAISQTLTEFMQDTYEEPYYFDPDYYFPEEYNTQIQNFTGYVVFSVTSEVDNDFKRTKESRTPRRFKFFFGKEDLPFNFMTPDTYWVLQPSKRLIHKCENTREVYETCLKIVEGEMKWDSFDKYI